MDQEKSLAASLLPSPESAARRLLLVGVRRMACHGIHDGPVTMLFLREFSLGFRRPLILLRALMVEVAQVSQRIIMVAPCCAPGMTADEALLIHAVAASGKDHRAGDDAFNRLCRTHSAIPLATAAALAAAFADLGMPLD